MCICFVVKVLHPVHSDVCGEAVIYVAVGAEPVHGVTKDPFDLPRFRSQNGGDRCPEFEYAFHEGDGSVVGWVW